MNIERQKAIKDLDNAVSSFIISRDKYCVICGTNRNLTNGHLFTRESKVTRWDTSEDGNCHCQCVECNQEHEINPSVYEEWYINKFGMDSFERLKTRFYENKPIKTFEILERIKDLEGRHSG